MANEEPGVNFEKHEQPATYVVQNRSSEEELMRLDAQDRVYTTCMGGVLPEFADPTLLRDVLDVGCGPGGWLIETARTYPQISRLVGIDVNARIINYAQGQAERAQVGDRVQFQIGDALRILDFRSNSFDLVNQRFGFSFLRTWDWPQLLREYYRICKAGGVIRITESSTPRSNSPAMTRLLELFSVAFYNAGHAFDAGPNGVIGRLLELMQNYGIEQLQTREHIIRFHADPVTKQAYAQNMHRLYRTALPFLRKWTRLPDDYEEIYQQMAHETQQPGWEIEQTLLTVWGTAGETPSSWSR